MSTIKSIWTKFGSEKIRNSQALRTLINALLELGEQAQKQGEGDIEGYKLGIARIFREYFQPDIAYNINEQIQMFLLTLGWKNSEIRVISATEAKAVLGNNRFIPETGISHEAIKIFIEGVFTGIGYYVFSKEVKVEAIFDELAGAVWNVALAPSSSIQIGTKTQIKNYASSPSPQFEVKEETTTVQTSPPSMSSLEEEIQDYITNIDPEQILTPIFNKSLGLDTLYRILIEIMSDFIRSKYQTNPLEHAGAVDHKVAVLILVKFLVEKSLAEGMPTSTTGHDVGKFFGKGVIGIAGNDPNAILIQEITESQSTTIIRDIKARCFCFLKPGERCQPSNVQLCDFIMGIWEGALTEILGKELRFTNRYPATKRKDKYCLMELSIKPT